MRDQPRVTVQDADAGDTTTMVATVITAAEQIETVRPAADAVRKLVADKGYHSNQTLVDLAALGVRTYISEPDRGRRHWRGKASARDAVYANRRRIRGARGTGCCGNAGSGSSAPTRISTRPGGCGGCICADTTTS